MADVKKDPKADGGTGDDAEPERPVLSVRDCRVCGRPTALEPCPFCGFEDRS